MTTKIKSGALAPPSKHDVAEVLGISSVDISWLAGDGSDRCYYRITSSEIIGSHVLMQLSDEDAKLLTSGGYEWIEVGKVLATRGIVIPKVIATMPEQAALIIEDYGNDMLETLVDEGLEASNWSQIKNLYAECNSILSVFLMIDKKNGGCWTKRSFDNERYVWELKFFLKKYIQLATDIELSKEETSLLEKDINALSQELGKHRKYFVHRDFHSRNILYFKQRLAIIDFQDARLGPAAYDLVSLCFDSYVHLSKFQRLELFNQGVEMLACKCGEDIRQEILKLWQGLGYYSRARNLYFTAKHRNGQS